MLSSGSSGGADCREKMGIIQPLFCVFFLCAQCTAQSNTGNELFIKVKLGVAGIATGRIFRLMLNSAPLRQEMEERLRGNSAFQAVSIVDFSPRPGQMHLTVRLTYQELTQGDREDVARSVLQIERTQTITASNVTFTIVGYIGIFDRLPENDEQSTNDAIDWCSPGLSSCREGSNCTDAGLRFSCPCKDGFFDNGTVCIPHKKLPPVRFNFSPDFDVTDKTSPHTRQLTQEITQIFETNLVGHADGVTGVIVSELRPGSVIAYVELVMNIGGPSPNAAFYLLRLAGQTVTLMNHEGVSMDIVFKSATETNEPNECKLHQELYPQNCSEDHWCQKTGDSTKCICRIGYQELNDGQCIDVDECTLNIDGCEHICENTQGGFSCSCRDGFVLNVDRQTCRERCGEAFSTAEGAFQYSGSFDNECIWTITTTPGTTVELTVTEINTNDFNCISEHFEIRDGNDETSSVLAELCGKVAPGPLTSTGNHMYIRLVSSWPDQKTLSASWRTVCRKVITSDAEKIQSPGYPSGYPSGLDCTYLIELPNQFTGIDLQKETFQLSESANRVCMDYLNIGSARYCGTNFPSALTHPSRTLVIQFHSDRSSSSSTGFSIQLKGSRAAPRRPPLDFCAEWREKNENLQSIYSAGFDRLPQCPCAMRNNLQINNMQSYGFTPEENSNCYHLSRMAGQSFRPYGKYCCYKSDEYGTLDDARNLVYNPSIPEYTNNYRNEDLKARTDCGRDYDTLRPNLKDLCNDVRNTNGMAPVLFGGVWGEPHIITLDKTEYTFNGWGEYTLLRVSANGVNVTLQGRTEPFEMDAGRIVNATVFTAFALNEGGSTVFVELDQETKTGLIVYGNDRDLTLPFREDPAFVRDTEEYLLRRQNDSLLVAFPSGIGLKVAVRKKTLAVSVGLPLTYFNQTKGLLGNFNENMYDDFVLPNGTVLPNNLTEREIFYNFGNAWAVTEADTVMKYGPREGPSDYAHPEFVPMFLDEQPLALRQSAAEQCHSDNIACVYDFIATGNRELALDSETVQKMAEETARLEKNKPPILDAPSTLHVSPNTMVNFSLQGRDFDDEPITFHALNITNGYLDVNSTSGKVFFRLPAENPPRLSFYAMDPKGEQSVSEDVLLLICDCGANGQCSFPNSTRPASEHYYFQYVECECSTGWDGDKCDQDRDGCRDSPCLPGQNCTDLSPAEERRRSVGYDCGPCPRGYIASSTSSTGCRDIDECSDSQVNQCSHVCINTEGSFHCGCRSGYRLGNDGRSCLDVNECAEKFDGCPQNCRNTVGGFECVCEDGYNYNQANNSCTADVSTASLCRNAGCSQGCKPTSGGRTPQCFCFAGYDVDSTNPRNCVDRDECQSSLCSQRCSNTQGSFTCSCHSGFQLNQDQRTCTRCPELRYGLDCSQTCNCSGRGLGCHPVTGCVCPGGWTGGQCEQDVDECSESPELCGADRDCANTEGSYACECPLGYTLDDSDQCQDFDECAENYHTCSPDENCVNVPGGFNCTCKPGYHREGGSCVDIDECAQPWSNKCQQECVNVPGSFNCRCFFRYKLASDRLSCVAETDLCKLQSGQSMNCQFGCGIAEDDSVYCLSPPSGFRYDNTTRQFVDIDECQNTSSCSHTCTNTEGSFNCSCPAGMYLDNDRRTCLTCPAGTYGRDCSQQCNCGRGAARCDVIRGCVCAAGWTGSNCDVDRDECDDASVSRQCGSHASCVNTPGSYRCQCDSGYAKNSAGACADVDECASRPCEQGCENSAGSYRCLCTQGFSLNAATGTCTDIDECASSSANRCSQVCLNNPGSYVCACNQAGFTLDDDGVTCSRAPQLRESFFLMASGAAAILRMGTGTNTTSTIPISGQLNNPIAVDYDPVEQRVYWTEVGFGASIRSAPLSGGNFQTIFNMSYGLLDGLAVDSLSRLLFYADAGNKVIAMVTMSTHVHKTVVNSSLNNPRAIVLDTANGVMYWTDWGDAGKIERANYDGSNRSVLVNTGLVWPNGLAVDFANSRLYWADADRDLIEASDLQGNGRRTLVPTQSDRHYFGLALFNNALYVTDWGTFGVSSVLRHSLSGSGNLTTVLTSTNRLNDIHVYLGESAGSNGCGNDNGGCSSICIPLPSNRRKCMCPDCQRLSSDGRTCVRDTGVTCNL